MKNLRIAKGLTLPLEVVTQTIGVLAKRRAGKSYAMRRLAEQLLKAGQQVVIVDPKGDQWGIRSAADGVSPGLPVVILGGERADVPLEVHSGEIVAKLVVEDRVSVLLDLSLFRKHEVSTFMSAFLENLYRLKAREIYRTPMMLIIDEADAIAPQKPMKGEERMLGAAEDIVRRGGQRGIGCTLVTQRSAVINKNVLTQIQILVSLRTIAPQDLAAIDAWIDVHGTEKERKTLKESLPSLPTGDAWFWSPGWPTVKGIFERVHILPIETFDSGATPKPGEKRVEPKNLADVDLDALTRQMAATIEKAKAENPKELQKRIKELEGQLARVPAKEPAAGADSKSLNHALRQEKAATSALKKALEEAMKFILNINAKDFFLSADQPIDETAITSALKGAVSQLTKLIEAKLNSRNREVDAARKEGQRIIARLQKLLNEEVVEVDVTVKHNEPFTIQSQPVASPARERKVIARAGNGHVSGPQQRILNALAWLESIGVSPVVKKQIALMAEQSPTSGSFFNNLGTLRSAGLIDYPNPGSAALTNEGRAVAAVTNVPTTSEDLQQQVCSMVSGPQAAILREAISAHPNHIPKNELAEKVGQSPTSGSYFNNLGRLRSLGLIDYPQSGYVVASSVLFLEG